MLVSVLVYVYVRGLGEEEIEVVSADGRLQS